MKIVKKKNTYFMNLDSKDNTSIIDKLLDVDFEVIRLNNDVFSLVRKNNKSNSNYTGKTSTNLIPTNVQKIYALLNDKNLPINNKVEGVFEKLLSENELKIFKELLDSKKIVSFKLSEKYKKGIYKVNDSFSKHDSNTKNASDHTTNNELDFSEFDKNKWIILPNKFGLAFSKLYKDQLECKDIIGLKSFDSSYYIIDSGLYQNIKNKILELAIKNDFEIKFIENKLSLHKDLVKIVLEILKEDGIIIEKRKGIYLFI